MSVNISSNPWHVSSLQDFQYFCCPECDSRLKDTQTFIDHAVLLHEQAKETLVNLHLIPKPIEVKTEIQDVYEYEELECDEDPLYNASDVIISTIEPMKQEFQQVNIESFIKQEIVEVKEDFSETEAKSDLVTDAKSDSRYECDQCPKSYKSRQGLENHVRTKHEESSFKCDHCNESFVSFYRLQMHELKHPTQSFKCHLCQKVCGSQTGLDFHVTTHLLGESNNKILKCDHCSYTTFQGPYLKKHLAEKHGIGEARFKCDICNRVFSSSGHLKNHREGVHLKNVKYKCNKCNYFAYCEVNLKGHKRTNHSRNKSCDDDYLPSKSVIFNCPKQEDE